MKTADNEYVVKPCNENHEAFKARFIIKIKANIFHKVY